MEYLLFALFVIAAAFTFARVEIEIEGPHGWAENLPTWRISNRWTKLLYGSRPLTGYHLWMQLFVVLMAQLPFALSAWHLTWGRELQVVGFIMLFFIIEDFLWFVLNPAYGLRRFRRENIWWHAPTWWWIMPRCYWIFTAIGLAAFLLGRSLDSPSHRFFNAPVRPAVQHKQHHRPAQSPHPAPATRGAGKSGKGAKKPTSRTTG